MTDVEAFKKHVLTRQLKLAQVLGEHFQANTENDPLSESAFAIMHLCMQYFEMIEKISSGDFISRTSKKFFRGGFLRVFPSLPSDDVDHLYEGLRCGMFHSGIPELQLDLDRNFGQPFLL